jgi:hypothetical protein
LFVTIGDQSSIVSKGRASVERWRYHRDRFPAESTGASIARSRLDPIVAAVGDETQVTGIVNHARDSGISGEKTASDASPGAGRSPRQKFS